MRVKGVTIQKFVLGAALLAGLAWNLAHSSEIRGVRIEEGATGTRADIALDRPGAFKVIRLKSPERLAVDLPESTLASGLKLSPPAGIVQAVRSGKPANGTVRIVFDLAQPVAATGPRIETDATGTRLVIEWPGDPVKPATATTAASTSSAPDTKPQVDPARASAEATTRLISELVTRGQTAPAAGVAAATQAPQRPAEPAAAPASVTAAVAAAAGTGGSTAPESPKAPGTPQPSSVPPTTVAEAKPGAEVTNVDSVATQQPVPTAPVAGPSRPLRPLVIAIDPGHGGQDPGAIGLEGSREKDVTLAIARELARQINATPGLKAYLTRDNDVFLPLPRRAQLARQARADMFISIHADAAENRAAHGSSVYVLSTKGASSQRARWLADKENASDLIGGVRLGQASGTLASVLLDLTQSGHMKASEDAASQVLAGLRRVGRNHKPSVERANFAVLRTSDMPAMLVETAFISNPDEERRLVSPTHQKALAAAVLDGINAYFTRQPPPGTMYAMRAQAQAGAAGGSP
ncbi:N-acetylmuramoyl-L-alanine amidase [Lysobacter korlensis]|uniref:N-acetylmuramoyl-L-alanine amidase n=1 Tax=Lysobacter korlensis TaxID=553636 RepID=A0ABV6RQC3_9GAMM